MVRVAAALFPNGTSMRHPPHWRSAYEPDKLTCFQRLPCVSSAGQTLRPMSIYGGGVNDPQSDPRISDKPSVSMRTLAQRLLAVEAAAMSAGGPHAHEAIRVCEKLRHSLSRFAGPDGFASLFRRAWFWPVRRPLCSRLFISTPKSA